MATIQLTIISVFRNWDKSLFSKCKFLQHTYEIAHFSKHYTTKPYLSQGQHIWQRSDSISRFSTILYLKSWFWFDQRLRHAIKKLQVRDRFSVKKNLLKALNNCYNSIFFLVLGFNNIKTTTLYFFTFERSCACFYNSLSCSFKNYVVMSFWVINFAVLLFSDDLKIFLVLLWSEKEFKTRSLKLPLPLVCLRDKPPFVMSLRFSALVRETHLKIRKSCFLDIAHTQKYIKMIRGNSSGSIAWQRITPQWVTPTKIYI